MAESIGQRANLPPINFLNMDKIKRENTFFSHSVPVTSALPMGSQPLASPSTMYSGPPPPYSYPSSTASSVVGGKADPPLIHASDGYMSPPHTARLVHDTKDHHLASAPPRHALPSIQEALKCPPGETSQNISISSLLSSSNPSPPKSFYAPKSSPTEPSWRYAHSVDARGSEDRAKYSPTLRRPNDASERAMRPTYSPRMATDYGTHSSPSLYAYNGHHPPQPSRPMGSPPGSYGRPEASVIQRRPASPAHDQPSGSLPNSSTVASYTGQQPAYSYPPTNPGIPSYLSTLPAQSTWRPNHTELERAEEVRKATAKDSPSHVPAYGESVKRYLDIFDIETSLNEIANGSANALKFSQHYGVKAHQTQRSGPIPGSMPSLAECEDIIQQQHRVTESLTRIKEVIIKQQAALVEQRNYDEMQSLKQAPPSEPEDEQQSYMDPTEGAGGFAGADAKKRRGRAAPPGRCHSCNRAETPEWRRGPDGARTLCNACGLHYAKLTRKMGSKTSSGPSNLRPKECSPSSP